MFEEDSREKLDLKGQNIDKREGDICGETKGINKAQRQERGREKGRRIFVFGPTAHSVPLGASDLCPLRITAMQNHCDRGKLLCLSCVKMKEIKPLVRKDSTVLFCWQESGARGMSRGVCELGGKMPPLCFNIFFKIL